MIGESITALGGVDLFFFVGYLVAVLVIGFAVGLREKATVGDYFRAGNRLPSSRRRRLPG